MDLSLAVTPIVRDVVIVEGSDARAYLQTQLSQDVEAVPLGGSSWSFILDPKSSVEALVRVTRIGNERIALDVDDGFGHIVRERLDGLLFRTDARFSEFTWPGLAWRGPGAFTMGQDAPIVAVVPWTDVESLDVVGPGVAPPPDAALRDRGELDAIRVAAGWPLMGHELGPGITPAMTGLIGLSVSFDKGCYTGQELVARTFHRGAAPPKRLVRLAADHPLERGDRLQLHGNDVGEVTSAAGSIGLGYLMRKVDTPVEVTAGDAAVYAADV
jgi:folate-binding protein YgfZ